MEKQEFSKYERARIVGARGLQVSMDAPLLLEMDEKSLEEINYDPLKIAEKELDSGVLPISVKRPLPEKEEMELEKVKIDDRDVSDEVKIKTEQEAEKEISEGGEIMEIANPEDEQDGEQALSNPASEAGGVGGV